MKNYSKLLVAAGLLLSACSGLNQPQAGQPQVGDTHANATYQAVNVNEVGATPLPSPAAGAAVARTLKHESMTLAQDVVSKKVQDAVSNSTVASISIEPKHFSDLMDTEKTSVGNILTPDSDVWYATVTGVMHPPVGWATTGLTVTAHQLTLVLSAVDGRVLFYALDQPTFSNN